MDISIVPDKAGNAAGHCGVTLFSPNGDCISHFYVTHLIRVQALMPGEAPAWVRAEWNGMELPVHARVAADPADEHGAAAGHEVPAVMAFELLRRKSPSAYDWWKTHEPARFAPTEGLLFAAAVCATVAPEEPLCSRLAVMFPGGEGFRPDVSRLRVSVHNLVPSKDGPPAGQDDFEVPPALQDYQKGPLSLLAFVTNEKDVIVGAGSATSMLHARRPPLLYVMTAQCEPPYHECDLEPALVAALIQAGAEEGITKLAISDEVITRVGGALGDLQIRPPPTRGFWRRLFDRLRA